MTAKHMLMATIPVADPLLATDKILHLPTDVDGVELRLDYLDVVDIKSIALLRNSCNLPVIFTLRREDQGGNYRHAESQRLEDILALCALDPEYLDLEYDVPQTFVHLISMIYPSINIILSYHQHYNTPPNLLDILYKMQCQKKVIYKLATYARSCLDSLRMVQFVRENQHKYRLIGLCMGEDGVCTRILSPMMGNVLSYAYVDTPTAAGQLSVDELINIYNYSNLNTKTRLYFLLGAPIAQSIGHIVHNKAIRLCKINAVYCKLRIKYADLADSMALLRKLPVDGLSITMPLKEAIINYMDIIEETSLPIKSLNTMVRRENKWVGLNTDGLGAIQALTPIIQVTNQTILILGAGGAARAIAYTARQQNAHVIIVNRTLKKAQELAAEFGGEAYSIISLPQLKSRPYNIIINTLPEQAYTEIAHLFNPNNIRPNSIAMDIVYQPHKTKFLHLAKKAKCITLPGLNMYINQALLQIVCWFAPDHNMLRDLTCMISNYRSQDYCLEYTTRLDHGITK